MISKMEVPLEHKRLTAAIDLCIDVLGEFRLQSKQKARCSWLQLFKKNETFFPLLYF